LHGNPLEILRAVLLQVKSIICLNYFAAGDCFQGGGEKLYGAQISGSSRQCARFGKHVVAQEHCLLLPPQTINRGSTPADRRIVDGIIMNQGGRVHYFNRRGHRQQVLWIIVIKLAGKQGEYGTEPLAATPQAIV